MRDEVIKIINIKQAGIECKCYWNIDKIVYEFNKEETKPLFYLWCKKELK